MNQVSNKINKMELKKMNFTISSDPEVHLFDVEQNKVVSSIRVLKNDKYTPFNLGNGVKAYADSVLTEFTFPPSKTKKEFINKFKLSFNKLQKKLGSRYRLLPKAAHEYDSSELTEKAAWEVGCQPSYDCYTQGLANTPSEFADKFRTSSMHIHLGNEKLKTFKNRILATKLLDIIVGCASVIFDKDVTGVKRRSYYGMSGNHRVPEHGLEYRVLGGNVLNSPKVIDLIYDLVDYSLSHIESGTAEQIINQVNSKDVVNAINNCDKVLAEKILNIVELPYDLLERVKENYSGDLYENWGIKVPN